MYKSFLARTVTLVTVVAIMTTMPPSLAKEHTTLPAGTHAQVADALRSSPLMFIENAGQCPDNARFQVRGGDRTIWLAEDAIWVTVVEPTDKETRTQGDKEMDALSPSHPVSPSPQRGVNLKLSFVGANPHPRSETFNRLDTHVSYFISNDPEQWRSDVPVWGGVRYLDLYPGVDLEVTGEGGRWTWRLVCGGVDCQSALRDVRLRVEGADSVTLTPSPAPGEGRGGGLHLTTAVGEFTLPLLTVEGIVPDGQPATFNLEPGTFDVTSPFSLSPPLPLSVSPQDNPDDLLYSTFLGGSDDDGGRDIAVDASGAAYVTGSTASSDFPTTPGAFDTLYSGGDGFVVKVNADGTGLAYATFLSSGGSIAVDGAGSAYITGMTGSSDFPTTAGAFDRTYNGGYCDAFVVKLNADGTALTYATFLGGSDWDWGHAIAVDGSGAAYITGWTNSSNFPTTSGAFDRTHNGAGDIFVAKLNATGSALDYATFVGGDAGDRGLAIAVDESGAAYVTGEAGWGWPHEFPTTPGAFDRSHDGYDDAFVVKLNPAGSALVYATFLGGSNDEWGFAIAVDGNGAAYVTGSTNSSDFPTTFGAFDTTYNGGTCGADCQPRNDIFVTKVNPSGSDLIYSTFLGGSYDEWGNAIAVDGTGSAYITGRSQSSDFPTTAGAFDASLDGSDDALLAKVNADGTGLACATFLGGSGWDGGYGIAVDGSGAAYVTGRTDSSDFPITPGAFDTSLDGDTDAFVAKLAVGSGPGLTPVVSTLTPDLSPEDPLHQVILKGSVDPRGGTVQVWFEWGSDPDLTTYQITGTQTVSGSPVTVTATISVPLGVKHFYRIASSDLGGEIVNFTILLGDPKAVSNPIWSTYDRLIEAYAAQYNIPATVLKAVMVQESSLNKSAFRYEPIPMRKIRDEIKPHLLPYMLPGHPPSENEYPRKYVRNVPWEDDTPMVRLPSDITMGALWNGYSDRISMSEPSDKNWGERAQWRLTSSYGLGQLVYISQGDKIKWERPEVFYDPETNITATARNLTYCQGDFSDFLLEGMSRPVLQHNWGPLPCGYPSIEALRVYCQTEVCRGADCKKPWCSRSDLWQGDKPAYLALVANRLPKVQPTLVLSADTGGILSPSVGGAEMLHLPPSTLGTGETELDRLIADLKGTGQSQLAVLYGIGDGSGMEGVLRVFADTEGSALEWESQPMPGITLMGAVYTQTLRVGGAPLIVASWGVGAHGMLTYFFRWQGGQFREISVEESGGAHRGIFADASIDIDAQGLFVAQRDSEEPLAVTILSTYSWQDDRAAFVFEGREIISPIPFRLYLPLVIRSGR